MISVIEEYQPHDPPHVVYEVGVEELHGPALTLRRETAEHKDFGISGEKWFEGMGFYGEILSWSCIFHFAKVIQIWTIYFEKCYLCVSDF